MPSRIHSPSPSPSSLHQTHTCFSIHCVQSAFFTFSEHLILLVLIWEFVDGSYVTVHHANPRCKWLHTYDWLQLHLSLSFFLSKFIRVLHCYRIDVNDTFDLNNCLNLCLWCYYTTAFYSSGPIENAQE